MFTALATALAAGLQLWEHKERTKYIDELMQLKQDHYDEMSKPDAQRNDASIDYLEFRLRVLASAFAASVGAANTKA